MSAARLVRREAEHVPLTVCPHHDDAICPPSCTAQREECSCGRTLQEGQWCDLTDLYDCGCPVWTTNDIGHQGGCEREPEGSPRRRRA